MMASSCGVSVAVGVRITKYLVVSLSFVKSSAGPDLRQLDHDADRGLQVLARGPLEARVEVVLAGEEVGRRQPHERETRPVRAAADRLFDRGQAGATDRLARALDDRRMAVEDFAHVAVLLLDLELDLRAGLRRDRTREPLDERLLLPEARGDEVAQEHPHRRPIDRG